MRTALYLMFNEGYSASSGEALVQPEFCVEAVRLARALAQHPVTAGPASDALAALLALTAARLSTRVGPDGVAQLLEDQPRDQWDHGLIALGLAHLERAARGEELTVWHLRAEIASLHAMAPSAAATDWPRIAAIYDDLLALDPSPVVEPGARRGGGPRPGGDGGSCRLAGHRGQSLCRGGARRVPVGARPRRRGAQAFREAMVFARTEPERRLMERRLMRLGLRS